MPEWRHYFCTVNDKLSSIMLDLNLRDNLPDPARPELIWIWLYLKAPLANGLSNREEFETLCQIEDALTARMEAEYKACLTGRITGDGRREFYYYGRLPSQLGDTLSDVMSPFKGYRIDWDHQPDPEWRQYLDVLYPNEENQQCIKNIELLDALAKHGNNHKVIRPVWHYVFFDDESGIPSFIQWSESNGYEVTTSPRVNATEPLEPGMLSIVSSHTTRPDDIDDHVLEVFRAARRLGGKYDGWETSVEKGQ